MIPAAFRARAAALLGEESEAFLRALAAPSVRGLRVNPGKARPGWLPPYDLAPVPWAENGYSLCGDARPGRDWRHEAGLYYLQEPSAMCVAAILDPRPGERVLDLCAAPGGKTTHAAALMRDTGLLIANETVPARARILAENVRRMGLGRTVVINESPARLAVRWPGYFDAVIVDAPCSGEGMFRKNGDAARAWSAEAVAACAVRQARILDAAAELPRQGGRIVYSTCTFAPEEDEETIAAFLARHPDYELARITLPGLSAGFDPEGKTARIFPHRARGEGHFAALLRRAGPARHVRIGAETPAADRGRIADYRRFADATLARRDFGACTIWGDTLYAVGEPPDLGGVKTLLPGLELGVFRKGRFEPAHALALALTSADAPVLELDERRAERYYAGETLPADAPDGWRLATADGYTLGWVKVSEGQAKNRLPKALRKTFADAARPEE